jgi:hypothetical protein
VAIAPATPRRKRGRIGLVAAALVLLLASGIGAAVALVTTGEESGDPEPDPSTPASTLASTPASPTPSADERRAIASLTDALVAQGRIGKDSATCVAEAFIAAVGLDALVEAGFFDEDFDYVDRSQDAITPRMRKALTSVVSDCSLSGLRTP